MSRPGAPLLTVDGLTVRLPTHDGVVHAVTEDDFGRPKTSFIVCTFWFMAYSS